MNSIRVEIVSAEVAIFSGEASMVVAPGKDGDLGIAPKHTPLLTTLRPGEIELHKEDNKKAVFVRGELVEDPKIEKTEQGLKYHEMGEVRFVPLIEGVADSYKREL